MSIDKAINQPPVGGAILPDAGDMSIEVEIEPAEGAVVEPETPEIEPGHDDNLAESMEESDLASIASELEALIALDIAARSDWESTYKKGIKLLGLHIEERTEPWEGACGIVHPMISEAALRFQSEMMVETFPASGPVRTKIIGQETPQAKQAAARVEEEMNHQLTDRMTEYRNEHERLMWNLPLIGSAFKKVYYDTALRRQTSVFVQGEDVILPYGSSDIFTAQRVTHYMRKTLPELQRLMETGFYRAMTVQESSGTTSEVQDAKDKEAGLSPVNDRRPEIYEVQVELNLDAAAGGLTDSSTTVTNVDDGPVVELAEGEAPTGDGSVTIELQAEEDAEPLYKPYVVTFVKGTQQVLSIRRNWDESDSTFQRKQHFVHYMYAPGFGAYGLGLIHLIGGHAMGATSLLRQLVDAGTLSNLPGGLKASGFRVKNDATPIGPGEFRDVDLPSGAIKDNIMPLPYKEPSAVLSGLLDKIVEQAQRFASTADVDIGKISSQAPVGTTLALLERTLKVMSAVQARCHAAMTQELRLLATIIRDNAPEDYTYDPTSGAPRRAKREDFRYAAILPVADPNAGTMSQRLMQYSAIMQMSQQAPQVYDLTALHREAIETIGIKNADKIVPMPSDMKPRDPVTENMQVLTGKPVKAFLLQDHEAHMAVHQMLLQDPKIQAAIGQNPQAQAIQAALMAHIAEHAGFAYRMQVVQQLGMPLPDPDEPLDPQVERELAPLLAQASQQALVMNQKMAVMQAQQQAAQDPAFALEERQVKVKELDAQTKRIKVLGDLGLAADKHEADQVTAVADLSLRREAQDATHSANATKLTQGERQAAQAPAGAEE